MNVVRFPAADKWDAVCERAGVENLPEAREKVQAILDQVRADGDQALIELTKQLDGVDLESLRVSESQIDKALDELDSDLEVAIRTAIRNVRTFHETQRAGDLVVET